MPDIDAMVIYARPGEPAKIMVSDTVFAGDSDDINATTVTGGGFALGATEPGTIIFTARELESKQKGLDGSWVSMQPAAES